MESAKGFLGVIRFSKPAASVWSAFASEAAPRPPLAAELAFALQFAACNGQIAVPNFVPCVPEIVPYLDVSSSYSIVLSRISL
jgi:hypothetical protein